jgi:hypothetical protein
VLAQVFAGFLVLTLAQAVAGPLAPALELELVLVLVLPMAHKQLAPC